MNPFKSLSKFEFILWLVSLVTVVLSYILSGSSDVLTILSSAVGVTALIFVAKGYVFGQVLTVVFSILYGLVSFYYRYYGEMITYMCMSAPIAIFSIISWLKHPYKGTKEVEVSLLSKRKIVSVFVLAVLVTVVFYYVLMSLDNENLIVSTLSITTSFIACYLSLLRSPYYAVAYGVNDVVLIVLWILASFEKPSYLPMVACFTMFLVNDIYGFVNWKKMQKNQRV